MGEMGPVISQSMLESLNVGRKVTMSIKISTMCTAKISNAYTSTSIHRSGMDVVGSEIKDAMSCMHYAALRMPT